MDVHLWTRGKNLRYHGRRELDGEQCWSAWCMGWNSFAMAAKLLHSWGVRTQYGTAYGRDAIAKAAWRWAFRNPEQALQMLENKHRANGLHWSQENVDGFWKSFVAHLYSIGSASITRELIKDYALEAIEEQFLRDTGKSKKETPTGKRLSPKVLSV